MTSVRTIDYEAEGGVMRGRLAVPDGEGPFPAVLVAHEANGLDDYQSSRAETLADLGYVAFALDYHGGAPIGRGWLSGWGSSPAIPIASAPSPPLVSRCSWPIRRSTEPESR